MKFLDTFLTAISSLAINKLRTSLALLGIVIGVSAVISTMAIGKGAQEQITSMIETLGTNLLFVKPGEIENEGQGSAKTLTLEDASALLDPIIAPSVKLVAPEVTGFARIVAGKYTTAASMFGVTPEYIHVRNLEMSSGTFITSGQVINRSNSVILGNKLSETLFGFRDSVGQKVRINGIEFSVSGILKSKGEGRLINTDNSAFIPISTAFYELQSQKTTQGQISVGSINVEISDLEEMDDAVQQIATVLRMRHRIVGEDDFQITSQQETIDILEDSTVTFVIFLAAIAGISLIVGGIGIMNVMLVSVTERTREIGIRKAMGAKWRDIMLQFVLEAILLCFTGGIAGAILGLGTATILDGKTFGGQVFNTAISLDITGLAIGVAVLIGLFFGIYPAARAANLHPIEALRYE